MRRLQIFFVCPSTPRERELPGDEMTRNMEERGARLHRGCFLNAIISTRKFPKKDTDDKKKDVGDLGLRIQTVNVQSNVDAEETLSQKLFLLW